MHEHDVSGTKPHGIDERAQLFGKRIGRAGLIDLRGEPIPAVGASRPLPASAAVQPQAGRKAASVGTAEEQVGDDAVMADTANAVGLDDSEARLRLNGLLFQTFLDRQRIEYRQRHADAGADVEDNTALLRAPQARRIRPQSKPVPANPAAKP